MEPEGWRASRAGRKTEIASGRHVLSLTAVPTYTTGSRMMNNKLEHGEEWERE